MSEVRIAAESRTEFGKGPSRRARRAGMVPVVLYGHGEKPRHYALPGHELMLALKHDTNVLLTLTTDEGDQLALPKAVTRHPVKRTLEHVDLLAVRRGEQVTVDVPLTLVGEAQSGTLVDQQSTTLTVTAEATRIPDHVEVSIEGLAVGGHIEAKDVVLPAGVALAVDEAHVVVAGLASPTAADVEADLAGAEAELGITHDEPTATAAPEGEAAPEAEATEAPATEE